MLSIDVSATYLRATERHHTVYLQPAWRITAKLYDRNGYYSRDYRHLANSI